MTTDSLLALSERAPLLLVLVSLVPVVLSVGFNRTHKQCALVSVVIGGVFAHHTTHVDKHSAVHSAVRKDDLAVLVFLTEAPHL